MQKIKCVFVCMLAFALLWNALSLPVSAAESPALSAQGAVLMEASGGRVLCAVNADKRMPMASTTKIMTALVAVELAAPATLISVSPAAVGVEGSSIYLSADEVLTLEELLYALLLESANDAAAAIAIGLCGSIEAFAEQMNRKAAALGLENTHFTNPHGLDDEEHYTTARELAIIARAALCHPLITTIVSTRKTTIPHVGIDSVRLLVNHNKLLRMYDGCIGVKTGFTKRSGRCLVSAAERDGVRLIAVTLNAPDDWQDHTALLDYGFSQYRAVTLCCAGDFSYALPVVNASNDVVCVRNTEALTLPLPNHRSSITVTVELPRFCYAPLTANEAVGRVVFHCDTDGDGTPEVIGTVALRTTEERPQKKQRRHFWQWLCDLFRRK